MFKNWVNNRLLEFRLLHRRFLDLPVHAILLRMCGVKDIVGKEVTAKKSLVNLVSEMVIGCFWNCHGWSYCWV